jgi:hypothetical protein
MNPSLEVFSTLPGKLFYEELREVYTRTYDPIIWKRITDLTHPIVHFMKGYGVNLEQVESYDDIFKPSVPKNRRYFSFGELIYLTTHMFVNNWYGDFNMIICPSVEMVFVTTKFILNLFVSQLRILV